MRLVTAMTTAVPHIHVRWLSTMMTVIPTCSCPMDICADDSYTHLFMFGGWGSSSFS